LIKWVVSRVLSLNNWKRQEKTRILLYPNGAKGTQNVKVGMWERKVKVGKVAARFRKEEKRVRFPGF